MAMTGRETVARVSVDGRVVGDAVRLAVMAELLRAVAHTVRFLLLRPDSFLYQRTTADERDVADEVADRIERATAAELVTRCPMCNLDLCETGCPLGPVREIVKADAALADATPNTEADRR